MSEPLAIERVTLADPLRTAGTRGCSLCQHERYVTPGPLDCRCCGRAKFVTVEAGIQVTCKGRPVCRECAKRDPLLWAALLTIATLRPEEVPAWVRDHLAAREQEAAARVRDLCKSAVKTDMSATELEVVCREARELYQPTRLVRRGARTPQPVTT